MRPKRCFIMPFRAARESRNAAVRLTREHRCPSPRPSCAANRPSRVRPALLTRMSSPPIAASAAGTSASTEAASARFAAIAHALARRARRRAHRAPRAACPTGQRRALRMERPGDRPADAAARAGDERASCRSRSNIVRVLLIGRRIGALGARRRPRRACRRHCALRAGRDALDQAGQDLAGADLDEARDAAAPPCQATHSRQRTVPVTCSTRRGRISVGSLTAAASTLATSGTAGAADR